MTKQISRRLYGAVLIVQLILGPLLSAQNTVSKIDAFGPRGVWAPSESVLGRIVERCYSLNVRKDVAECIISEMRAARANPEAITVVKLLGGEAYMTAFREKGRIDVATTSAFVYNSPELSSQELLVNGDPVIVKPCNLAGQIDIRQAAEYPELSKTFPEMSISCAGGFRTILPLPNSGQRFVFGFTLMNGCRACGTAGTANVAFDFDITGKYMGVKVMNLQGP